ncbi:MAG: methionyl-tRNA formyltransferase, partial [bacterium]|nr:methionyl-tRNA formyltransferase [bacterium]
TAIGPEETAVEVRERLCLLGADLLVETLRGLERGSISPVPQDHELATLAPMLKKETGRIDWSWSARTIHNRVRGLQPWPGAYTSFRGQPLHIWRSRIAEQGAEGTPGTLRVEKRRAAVVCGNGSVLELVEVQMQGRKRIAVDAFINGQRLQNGERFGGEDE